MSLGAHSLHDCPHLEHKCAFYEQFHEWFWTRRFLSKACNVHKAEFVDIMACLRPMAGTWGGNVARPVGSMMKKHWACIRQSGAVTVWWPFAVKPTTAGTMRARTTCPARACRRTPVLWLTRPIAVSWPQDTRPMVSTAASGPGLAATCTRSGRSCLSCPMCTLKGAWRMMASTQPLYLWATHMLLLLIKAPPLIMGGVGFLVQGLTHRCKSGVRQCAFITDHCSLTHRPYLPALWPSSLLKRSVNF